MVEEKIQKIRRDSDSYYLQLPSMGSVEDKLRAKLLREPTHEEIPVGLAVVARFEDTDWQVRKEALKTLGKLEPATLVQHAEDVALSLKDSSPVVRWQALKTLGKLEPATLVEHAGRVVVQLEDPHWAVRKAALKTLRKLKPATLAQHAAAVLARLYDSKPLVRKTALETLGKLEPATLAHYADDVIEMLDDYFWDWQVNKTALETLGKLEPATLAQHAEAVIAMLDTYCPAVREAALETLGKFALATLAPHADDVIACGAIAMCDDSRPDVRDKARRLSARLRWYNCRLRLRVERLALYWYALPYRPSGPGHARDVAAWDRMNETRGQTPRLQPPEQSGAEADESNSSESLAAPTWTCHRCRYLNYGAIRCALCGSPKKQPAAGPHETARARKRRR